MNEFYPRTVLADAPTPGGITISRYRTGPSPNRPRLLGIEACGKASPGGALFSGRRAVALRDAIQEALHE